MHRLFVALDLPAPVTDEIAAICHGLNGMRWVSPDNLHLTLRFIGEVPPSVTLEVEEGRTEEGGRRQGKKKTGRHRQVGSRLFRSAGKCARRIATSRALVPFVTLLSSARV